VTGAHGVADILVNNAGIGMSGGFLDTTPADWKRIMDVNFWGVLHGSRVFGRQLVERGTGGRIVNIASAAAYSPSRVMVAYSTSKAAVLMLSECLTADFARDGIVVTAVCPGFVNTPIARTTTYVGVDATTEKALQDHAVRRYGRRNYSPEHAARRIVEAIKGDKAVVTITPEATVLRLLDRFAPALQRRLARADLTRT
jgi:NAD(P)-dependent dehydrogenase (short-subunit alcohol dehydrogenase family)